MGGKIALGSAAAVILILGILIATGVKLKKSSPLPVAPAIAQEESPSTSMLAEPKPKTLPDYTDEEGLTACVTLWNEVRPTREQLDAAFAATVLQAVTLYRVEVLGDGGKPHMVVARHQRSSGDMAMEPSYEVNIKTIRDAFLELHAMRIPWRQIEKGMQQIKSVKFAGTAEKSVLTESDLDAIYTSPGFMAAVDKEKERQASIAKLKAAEEAGQK